MRHLKKSAKLGRSSAHRNAMLANLACSLIKSGRITTTIEKAKALRPFAEKLISIGKRGRLALERSQSGAGDDVQKWVSEDVHCRRIAAARLRQQSRTLFKGTARYPGKQRRILWKDKEDVVHILFGRLAPKFMNRCGGYSRILRLGQRRGDAASMAVIEWVDNVGVSESVG